MVASGERLPEREEAMSRENTKLGQLGSLQTFRDALNANKEALPHLEVSVTQYDGMVTKALDLTGRQKALGAEKQEASKQLRETLIEAERLGTLLRLAVKQHFGIRAEKLAEFNLQPFRGRKRTAPVEPTPQEKKPTE
jgi:hypothetical protein